MSKIRDIPVEGQRIKFNQFTVEVKRMNGPRIVLVSIYPEETVDIDSLH